jgi:hypothetical protein
MRRVAQHIVSQLANLQDLSWVKDEIRADDYQRPMTPLLWIPGLLILAGVVAHVIASIRFLAQARRLAEALAVVPAGTGTPPQAMRAFAERNGGGRGGPVRAVRLTQEAEFRGKPGGAFAPMPATQTIGVGTSGFVWLARQPGPVGPIVRVIDAFVDGKGRLEARLAGSIPVARQSGAVVSRSEAMRYLAELPWAPDAILGNPEIAWTERPDGWTEAALIVEGERVAVRFRLSDGDIVEVLADDRPEQSADGRVVERAWRGVFSDYREIGGRRIPTTGAVGYPEGDNFDPYWKGRVVSYQILR